MAESPLLNSAGRAEPSRSPSVGDSRLVTLADFAAETHGGPVRVHNEDHCLALVTPPTVPGPKRYLLAVADGLGGRNAGEIASQIAVEALASAFAEGGSQAPRRWMTRAIRQANLAVFNRAHADSRYRGMQTTLTALLIQGDQVAIGHVGDCRVYRFRGGAVRQLTQDHTRLLDLMRLRLINAEQALTHPARHLLTRSLGAEPIVAVDVTLDKAEAGDTYLVCSDGVWGALSRGNLQRVVVDLAAAEACHRLIELGEVLDVADNVSVGVAHVLQVAAEPNTPSVLRRLWRVLSRSRV